MQAGHLSRTPWDNGIGTRMHWKPAWGIMGKRKVGDIPHSRIFLKKILYCKQDRQHIVDTNGKGGPANVKAGGMCPELQ